ncbi:MAG: glycoside hydrolase family 65 protein [Prevotellaceae bacterium]|jgi:maltose phosphorylase|nr:glycoside hydrolase family 65 protein [Prevotellaceae bacterium]
MWKIVEDRFVPERVKASESLFSIGNGRMGQRANFEEAYTGETLQGSYIGGVYYPDKTRVGWWKNGYPEYFAKVLNSAFWIGIDVKVNGDTLDLHTAKVLDFYHELDMQHGLLTRRFTAELPNKTKVAVEAVRFVSIVRTGLGAISYTVQPLSGDADIEITPFTNAGVRNEDANYDETFWDLVSQSAAPEHSTIVMRTKKTNFSVCWHSDYALLLNGNPAEHLFTPVEKPAWVGASAKVRVGKDERLTLYKYTGIANRQHADAAGLAAVAKEIADKARRAGYLKLKEEQSGAWQEKWRHCDVEIGGDEKAQQGIRFCIFQLLQTYTGEDPRLNVGPKGFTGEKYGGGTYWDTEACCLPFYLSTVGSSVARNLLLYRYNQLPQAIENAKKLGLANGAALYPMVTMNGEECHNEWEITFEEIHRNGAIAYAVFNYIRYTGDRAYLTTHGLEVLIGIARFWAQRITWSGERNRYVMLGVTGPNEYENNVNNNWYTNYIACWCLRYTRESMEWVKQEHASRYDEIIKKTHFDELNEWTQWNDITEKMYFPCHERLNVFLQQDGYMDKEQVLVKDLDPAQRPLNQKWSWDRILRSCFIKQADVLQGLYFFEDDFDEDTLRRNFRFYEARTVHESSLSPCVHAVLAAKIGDMDKAYEMYLRTARLDLDDYNKEVGEGLHITSMAGSWLAVIQGFAGMRVRNGELTFNPQLPAHWTHLSFSIQFRGETVKCKFDCYHKSNRREYEFT